MKLDIYNGMLELIWREGKSFRRHSDSPVATSSFRRVRSSSAKLLGLTLFLSFLFFLKSTFPQWIWLGPLFQTSIFHTTKPNWPEAKFKDTTTGMVVSLTHFDINGKLTNEDVFWEIFFPSTKLINCLTLHHHIGRQL